MRFTLVSLIWMSLLFGSVSRAGLECPRLAAALDDFRTVEDLARPYAHFEHRTDRYALQSAGEHSVRHQCAYGSCWAHSSLSVYEYRAKKRGVNVELSEDFLIVSQLALQASEAIRSAMRTSSPNYVVQGYDDSKTAKLIEQYGLMPKSAFRNKLNMQSQAQLVNRFILQVNTIVREAEWSDEHLAMEKIHQLLVAYFGKVPSTFEFEGRSYTPQTFAAADFFRPLVNEPLVIIENKNTKNSFLAIKNHLDRTGEPVKINLRWTNTFIDTRTGVISVAAFNLMSSMPETLIEIAQATSDSPANYHALDIVDYEVDSKGNPVKFLAINSWGKNSGDKGYYHI